MQIKVFKREKIEDASHIGQDILPEGLVEREDLVTCESISRRNKFQAGNLCTWVRRGRRI